MRFLALLAVLVLAACASAPPPAPGPDVTEAKPVPRPGGFYKDDGPGENPPADLASIPDAVPKAEAPNRYANRPYTVFGASYVPLATGQGYKERGVASWYGKKFHGQKTSSGEPYDMYAMTGAHKTLPIPSYARVTNLANGRSVVVRINDRGPFHSERLIDLSYAAAYKLGYTSAGSARVEVEAVTAEEAVKKADGIYLQMGAFGSKENAEELGKKVSSQLAWLTEAVQVVSINNLWRLQVGPYATSDAARAAAQRIESEINLKPLVVSR